MGSGVFADVCVCGLSRFSHVQLSATPWTVARQAPLSVGFSRQEYWSGWPFPSPGDLPNPGVEATSLMSPALTGGFFSTGKPLLVDVIKIKSYWISVSP